jgi:hypothetical protein
MLKQRDRIYCRVRRAPWWLAGMIVVGACGNDTGRNAADAGADADERNGADFRCRADQPDGSCVSSPANCPVTIPFGNHAPSCLSGTELIPIAEDHCAIQLICID